MRQETSERSPLISLLWGLSIPAQALRANVRVVMAGLSWLMLGEAASLGQVAGTGCLLAGVILSNMVLARRMRDVRRGAASGHATDHPPAPFSVRVLTPIQSRTACEVGKARSVSAMAWA